MTRRRPASRAWGAPDSRVARYCGGRPATRWLTVTASQLQRRRSAAQAWPSRACLTAVGWSLGAWLAGKDLEGCGTALLRAGADQEVELTGDRLHRQSRRAAMRAANQEREREAGDPKWGTDVCACAEGGPYT